MKNFLKVYGPLISIEFSPRLYFYNLESLQVLVFYYPQTFGWLDKSRLQD